MLGTVGLVSTRYDRLFPIHFFYLDDYLVRIPISFDVANQQLSELFVLRSQVNREFSQYSRLLARAQMHVEVASTGQICCSLHLRTNQGEDIVVSEVADTVKQAINHAIHVAQKRLREIETECSAAKAKLLRQEVPMATALLQMPNPQ